MAVDRYEWQKLTARLRRRLASGEWPVGTRIPTLRQLMESEGLSDHTVTKAMNALSEEGLIQPRVGMGTVVVALPEDLPKSTDEKLADLQDRVSALEEAERRRAEREMSED